jgi:predicted nucleotidyltransferase
MLVLRNYVDAGNADRLYEEAAAFLQAADFDLERSGAWLAGRDVRKLIDANSERAEALIEQLSAILRREIDADGSLELIGELGTVDRAHALTLFTAFERGLAGMDTP